MRLVGFNSLVLAGFPLRSSLLNRWEKLRPEHMIEFLTFVWWVVGVLPSMWVVGVRSWRRVHMFEFLTFVWWVVGVLPAMWVVGVRSLFLFDPPCPPFC